jgi:hypothetical protein
LRQVTRDDVTGWLDGRKDQANDASALRDLFRTLKSERLVFTNPTDRVRVVKPNQTTPNRRLTPRNTATDRSGRGAGPRPGWSCSLSSVSTRSGLDRVRALTLEHLDLPNARLDIGGTTTRTMDPVHRGRDRPVPRLPAQSLAAHRQPGTCW